MALNGFEAALKMRREARQEALEYDALIRRAQALGIPTDLDDANSPATVAGLQEAVREAEKNQAWSAPDPDITVTRNGELMVAGIQGENYDGIEFVDAYTHTSIVVADAGHIVLPDDGEAVEAFIKAARFDGFVVAEERQ